VFAGNLSGADGNATGWIKFAANEDLICKQASCMLSVLSNTNHDMLKPTPAEILARRLKQYIGKASFSSRGDQFSAEQLVDELLAMIPEWKPIAEQPETGHFLWYMPEEKTRKLVVAHVREKFAVAGGAFAFDLSKPTHFQHLSVPPET